MVVVHHLNNSRSQRVLWLLEELGVPYQIKHYARDRKTMLAPPALKAVHPLGKSPVITDGEITVAESGAIMEYLVERYGNGRMIPAAGTPERLRYRYWMHYAEGTFATLMIISLLMARIERAPLIVRPVAKAISRMVKKSYLTPNVENNLDFMEAELGQSAWFAGNELTAADVQMSFALEAAATRGGLDSRRPRLHALLARMHARPAYRRALEKGGPYQLMGGR
ncbi:MAG: glutathione S-transferase [Pseudomonadota bacterium]